MIQLQNMEFSTIIIYLTLFFALYFQIFMLLIILENKKNINKLEKKQNEDYFPSATIIVPCWNEEDTVAGTLNSLLDLNYPKEKLKIIVVDDGSTDKTAEEVKKFLPHPQIKFIQKENGGKHTAMNRALGEVDTELVGSLDADSFVDKNALRYIAPHFKNQKLAAVASTIKTTEDRNFWAMIQKAEFLTSAVLRKAFAFLGSIFITPGPFSILKASVVKELGGWKKAHNTEDMEIGVRIQINHYVIDNEENAIIYTKPLKTFKALYKQRLRWVYGFLKNAWDYKYLFFNPKYGNLGLFVLPSFVIGLILSILLYLILIKTIIFELIDWVQKVSITGFNFGWPNFDWFYFNTETATFITLILLMITIVFIIFAKQMTNEKKKIGWEIPFYILGYMVISPIWLMAALFKSIFGIENKWEDN